MPLVTIGYDKITLYEAFTCSPQQKPSWTKALMTELYEAAKSGLVKQVDELEEAIALDAGPFGLLNENRFSIEVTIRTSKTKGWGSKDDLDEIVSKLRNRMIKVLKKWLQDGHLKCYGWQLSIELIFIDKFAVSDPIQ